MKRSIAFVFLLLVSLFGSTSYADDYGDCGGSVGNEVWCEQSRGEQGVTWGWPS